jgi:hypothetical protein
MLSQSRKRHCQPDQITEPQAKLSARPDRCSNLPAKHHRHPTTMSSKDDSELLKASDPNDTGVGFQGAVEAVTPSTASELAAIVRSVVREELEGVKNTLKEHGEMLQKHGDMLDKHETRLNKLCVSGIERLERSFASSPPAKPKWMIPPYRF